MKSGWFFFRRYPISFWFWHLALPLLLGLMLWRVYPMTGLDALVQGWYFEPATRSFPLREQVWLSAGMHAGLKMLVVALSIAVFAVWLATFFGVGPRQERRRLGWIWIAIALAAQAVLQLKQASIHHCPWDIVDYGGYAPHLALFEALPDGIKPGRCFPGGHASGGFSLMALYFGLRDDRPQLARWVLGLTFALGCVMGWAQTMRGAHFLSHTLWSAWVVWLVLLLAYLVFSPQPKPVVTQ
jgi:membrane-associated PAP2 superfamily phosphatase